MEKRFKQILAEVLCLLLLIQPLSEVKLSAEPPTSLGDRTEDDGSIKIVPDGKGGLKLVGLTSPSGTSAGVNLSQVCYAPKTGYDGAPCCNLVGLWYCSSQPKTTTDDWKEFNELRNKALSYFNPFGTYSSYTPHLLPFRFLAGEEQKPSFSDYLNVIKSEELQAYKDYLDKFIPWQENKIKQMEKELNDMRDLFEEIIQIRDEHGNIQLVKKKDHLRQKIEKEKEELAKAKKWRDEVANVLKNRGEIYSLLMRVIKDPQQLKSVLEKMTPRERSEAITMLEQMTANGQIPPDVFANLMRIGEWKIEDVRSGLRADNQLARALLAKLGYGQILDYVRKGVAIYEGVAYFPPKADGTMPTMDADEFRDLQAKMKNALKVLKKNGISIDPKTGKLTLPEFSGGKIPPNIQAFDIRSIQGSSPEAQELKDALDAFHPELSKRLLDLTPGKTGENACVVVDNQVFRAPSGRPGDDPNAIRVISLQEHMNNANITLKRCNEDIKAYAKYLRDGEGIAGTWTRYKRGMSGSFWRWVGYEPQEWLWDWEEVPEDSPTVLDVELQGHQQNIRACIKTLELQCAKKEIVDQVKDIDRELSKKTGEMIDGILRDVWLVPVLAIPAAAAAALTAFFFPKAFLIGFFAGTALSFGRQTIAIYVDGCQKEYDWEEVYVSGWMGAMLAPTIVIPPVLAGLCVYGVYEGTKSALIEAKKGHAALATYDTVITFFFAWAGLRKIGQQSKLTINELMTKIKNFSLQERGKARDLLKAIEEGVIEIKDENGVSINKAMVEVLKNELAAGEATVPGGGEARPLKTVLVPCNEVPPPKQPVCKADGRCIPLEDQTPPRSLTQLENAVNAGNKEILNINDLILKISEDSTLSPQQRQSAINAKLNECQAIRTFLEQAAQRELLAGKRRAGMAEPPQAGQSRVEPPVTGTPGGVPETPVPRLSRSLVEWYLNQIKAKVAELREQRQKMIDEYKKNNPGMTEEQAIARLIEENPSYDYVSRQYSNALDKQIMLENILQGRPVELPIGKQPPPDLVYTPKPGVARRVDNVLNEFNRLMQEGKMRDAIDYIKSKTAELEQHGVKVELEKIDISLSDLTDQQKLGEIFKNAKKKAKVEWDRNPAPDGSAQNVVIRVPEIRVRAGAVPMDIDTFLKLYPEYAEALRPFRLLQEQAVREEFRHTRDLFSGNEENPLYSRYLRETGRPFELETQEFFNRLTKGELEGLTAADLEPIFTEYPGRLEAYRWWQDKIRLEIEAGRPVQDWLPPELRLQLKDGSCTVKPGLQSTGTGTGAAGMMPQRGAPRDIATIRRAAQEVHASNLPAADKVARLKALANEAGRRGGREGAIWRNKLNEMAQYWENYGKRMQQAGEARAKGDENRAKAIEALAKGKQPQEPLTRQQMEDWKDARGQRKQDASGRRTQIKPPETWDSILHDVKGGVTNKQGTFTYSEQYLQTWIKNAREAARRGWPMERIEQQILSKITEGKDLRSRVRELVENDLSQGRPPAQSPVKPKAPKGILERLIDIFKGG